MLQAVDAEAAKVHERELWNRGCGYDQFADGLDGVLGEYKARATAREALNDAPDDLSKKTYLLDAMSAPRNATSYEIIHHNLTDLSASTTTAEEIVAFLQKIKFRMPKPNAGTVAKARKGAVKGSAEIRHVGTISPCPLGEFGGFQRPGYPWGGLGAPSRYTWPSLRDS